MLVAMTVLTDRVQEMTGKLDTLQSTVDMLHLKVDDLKVLFICHFAQIYVIFSCSVLQ